MEKRLTFDFNNMMAERIGAGQGITAQELNEHLPFAGRAFRQAAEGAGKGMMGWTELPFNQERIVKDIIRCAKEVRQRFENFVVLGIGGSALGPFAVFQALKHLKYNDLPAGKRNGPRFFVEDNIDPERMAALLDVVDLETTVFNVITKSGATSETMSQFLIIYRLLQDKLGTRAKEHIIATTDSMKGNLIKIAKEEGFLLHYIPDGVGGRFSELCPVGLLPAAVLDINIAALLDGAEEMNRLCKEENLHKNPALMAALLMYLSMRKGKNISVMMPYADSLRFVSDWYCQLWGESLGKAKDRQGNTIFAGQTPVKALGVTDQHSQVQLYTEGPFDKVVTFVRVGEFRTQVAIPEGFGDIPDISFLGGYTLNQLIDSECLATEYALTKAGRPNCTILLDKMCEKTLGQLLQFYMWQTAFCGEMLGIDTYNQPGVEEGKNAAYALFGRKGYEEKKAEMEKAPKKKADYQI